MLSPKAIATLVSQMKPPLELQNDYSRMMWLLEQAATIAMKVSMDERGSTMKEDVMRLVEAQIAGGVDLSPEEMVEAAFVMVNKINDCL